MSGDEITDFKPGDHIQISDVTSANANLLISGHTLFFGSSDQYSVTIDNIGPGRFVLRSISNTGFDVQLQQAAHNDFNGDGRSDILWRNDDGTVRDWLGQADGTFVGNTANLNTTGAEDWHVAGTGDFNGDGPVDVLWRNDAGWSPNGSARANGALLITANVNPGTSWHVAGTGDFNGDGLTDILWRNDDGTMRDWLAQANGGFVGNAAHFNVNPGLSWHVVGTGDFNGDGMDDVLWQNDSGMVPMARAERRQPRRSRTQHQSGYRLAHRRHRRLQRRWRSDILWRNNDGTMRDWLAQSTAASPATSPHLDAQSGSDWHVAGIGDYNGDTIDDIILQNRNGTVAEWLGQTDGNLTVNAAVNVNPGTSWHVEDPFVHDPFAVV